MVPKRFTATVFSKRPMSCGPFEPAVFMAGAIPAQLTTRRATPWAEAACSSAALTLSSLVTSVSTKSAPISAATASPRSFCRSRMATGAPRSRKARAQASPSPLAPPVTTAGVFSPIFMVSPSG